MQDKINKPIFVVGSPRSGTSVLTWCLGQHPNIVTLEESGWMGDLAIDLAIRYQIGTARGDHSLLSSMGVEQEEFFSIFGKTINELILRHRITLERKQWEHSASPNALPDQFMMWKSGTARNPKARWVDGTPESSFGICGLRKLFPKALFIHVVRDVTSVVRSMLNFHGVGGGSLVANEEEAYNYWCRTVSRCLLAERAYGPRVVFRLRYSDFVDTPEAALRPLFNFLSEPFAAECLTPLQQRINSSNVPADFKLGDPGTDPVVVERARRLWTEVEETPQPPEASAAALQEIEAAFDERVQFVATLDSEYDKAQQIVAALQNENAKNAARYDEAQQIVAALQNENAKNAARAGRIVAALQNENAKNAARAERLAKEIKGKKAIIQHLRGRRQRHKLRLRRLLFGQN